MFLTSTCREQSTHSWACGKSVKSRQLAWFAPWQAFKDHRSGYCGRWASPYRATELFLDPQPHWVDFPTHTRATECSLLQRRRETDFCCSIPPVNPMTDPLEEMSEWPLYQNVYRSNCFTQETWPWAWDSCSWHYNNIYDHLTFKQN